MIVVPPVELVIPDDIIYTNVPADVIPPEQIEDEARYQMFAPISNQLTQSNTNIHVQIKPKQRWNTVMLFNVQADQVTATLHNGPSAWTQTEILRYDPPIDSELLNRPNVCLIPPNVDPAIYPNATLEVDLRVNTFRVTSCELLAVGWRTQIGRTCYGTTLEIVDYSRKERDTFGNITLIERGYSDRVSFKFSIHYDDIDLARDFLASRRAKPTGYLGTLENLSTFVFGLFQDFVIPVEEPSYSMASITVDSVVRTGVVDLDGPAELQAAFVDPNAYMTCLDSLENQGTFKRLYLDENLTLIDNQRFRVLVPIGREPLPGETLEWIVTWEYDPEFVQEHGTNVPTEFSGNEVVLQNNCEEWVAFYLWPHIGYIDQPLPESLGSLVLRFTDLEGTVRVSNAVTVVLTREQPECDSTTVDVFWYNEETDAFDEKFAFGRVDYDDIRYMAIAFDSDYYTRTYPAAAASVASREFLEFLPPDIVADLEHSVALGYPLTVFNHYHLIGDSENKKPNIWFDPEYYKANYPDVVDRLYPNGYFYSTLQHYQTLGYGEGRLPCHPDILNAAAIRPIGEFYWIGKVGTDWCSEGKCWVTWEWDFTGEIPPKIEFAKDTVVVCAEVEHCTTTLKQVSPGILTLIATVHCHADSEDLPPPEPIVLDPIYLILTLGGCSAPLSYGSSPQICTDEMRYGSAETAYPIVLNTDQIGYFDECVWKAWYSIYLTAGTTYIFTQRSTSVDSNLALLDESLWPLAGNDNYNGGPDSLFEYTPDTSGTYYVVARTSTLTDRTSGAYVIRVESQ